ncbi:Tuberculostearic acid methyltransferase UfaA1 [Alphaproteobacteria bacterium SO-S41]|nr:Tuberculostearic acid methyltransferase UfaA1 [Alphaproteobacteria bacterium SO-S41]
MSIDVTQAWNPQRPPPLWRRIASQWAKNLQHGRVDITFPGGTTVRFDSGAQGPAAAITIHRRRFMRRLALGGELGLAASYIDGDWSSPDIAALVAFGLVNHSALTTLRPSWPTRAAASVFHWLNANTRKGSRRNIAFHYDLGNAFYALWLDETMSYSSALFTTPGLSLAEAQKAKYERILNELGIAAGDRVLEIGCGWGGFAECAARRGAHVTALTLSREQAQFSQARMAAAGLSDLVDIRIEDYRDVQGSFDHIVSIEMLEAVGEKNWPTYFNTLNERLRSGGKAMIQVITVDDDVFDSYRRRVDFIQRYIFPGGMLLSPAALKRSAEQAGLSLDASEFFGADYSETLRQWAERFEAVWPQVEALGFDERFRRMWRYYLRYCQATFRTGATDVGQFVLSKP